ncbi:hypothetical protein EV360DRAFT_87350 [Lentinula raphanica]|nr:hypothetical protein EV360DRAFT_87350 [Lentinula raphanica]
MHVCSTASTSALSESIIAESATSEPCASAQKTSTNSASTATLSEWSLPMVSSEPSILEASCSDSCTTSSHDPARKSEVTPATSTSSVATFFDLAASTSSTVSTSNAASTPSPSTTSPAKKHSERSVVAPAVGGAVGGALFVVILAFLMLVLLRRNRHSKRPPSEQYLRTVRSVSTRATGAVSPDRDVKSPSSSRTTSPTKDTRSASYHSKPFMRPWTAKSESTSTFRDDSTISIHSISPPFIPPPPRTNVPEAQPPQERLPHALRNRPSRFVEQLTVNSTNLGVLVAIAKAEAEQKAEQRDTLLLSDLNTLDSENDNERQPQQRLNDSIPDTVPSSSLLQIREEFAGSNTQLPESHVS